MSQNEKALYLIAFGLLNECVPSELERLPLYRPVGLESLGLELLRENRREFLSPTLRELRQLQEKVNTPGVPQWYTRAGICYSLEKHPARPTFQIVATQWPEYSGFADYPVPAPDGGDPTDAYYEGPYWEGEYGETRKRLLGWSIDYLEELLK